MAQFIQQTIRLDSKSYNLKRNATLSFKSLVFVVVPAKWFHVLILGWRVPIVIFFVGITLSPGRGDASSLDLTLVLCADIAEYLHWYNTGRPHSSLGDVTPEMAYLNGLLKLAEAA